MKNYLLKVLYLFAFVAVFDAVGQTINVDGINYQLYVDSSGKRYAKILGYDGYTPNVKVPHSIAYIGNTYVVEGESLIFINSTSLVSVCADSWIVNNDCMFKNCINLEHINFTDSEKISDLGEECFYNCYKLDLSDVLGKYDANNGQNDNKILNQEIFGLDTPTQYDNFDFFNWELCKGKEFKFQGRLFMNRHYRSVKWPFNSIIAVAGDMVERLETNWGTLSGLGGYDAIQTNWYAPNLKEVTCHGEFFAAGGKSTPKLEAITLKNATKKVYLGYVEEDDMFGIIYTPSELENLSKLTIEDNSSIEVLKICGSNKLDLDWIKNCSNLKSFSLVDNDSVKSITLPSSTNSIYLYNLPSLTTINNIENVKHIDISNCPNLENLDLSSAEQVSLSNNSGLKNLYLGTSLKSYFSNFGFLNYDINDQELEIIYAGTIEQWLNINFDKWSESNDMTNYFRTQGFLANVTKLWYGYDKQKKEYLTELNDATLPENINQLKHGPFTGYRGLEKVILPSRICHIGYGTFAGCLNLRVIDVNPEEIQSGTFYNCMAISEITLGKNVKEITYAFPKELNNPYHFYYRGSVSDWSKVKMCNLTSMETENQILYTNALRNGCVISPFQYASQSNLIDSKTGELEITDPEQIGEHFNNHKLLKSVIIKFYRDAGTTIINPYAFSYCDSLESIIVENYSNSKASVQSHDNYLLSSDNNEFIVGEQAFSNCTKLERNEILNHLRSYGRDAMYNTAWINNQPDGPLYLCSSNQGKIVISHYKGIVPTETSIIIDRDATWFQGSSSFDYKSCSNVVSISLPEGLTVIEDYWMPEAAITASFEFPSTVLKIGSNEIYHELDEVKFCDGEYPIEHSEGCYYLKVKKLYIGRDVESGVLFNGICVDNATYGPKVTTISKGNSIGYSNTSETQLKNLYSLSVTPPACESIYDIYNNKNTFALTKNIDTDVCILHVPNGCYNAYRSAEGWNEFAIIKDDIETSSVVDIIGTDDDSRPEIHYDISGRIIDATAPGLHIVKKGTTVFKTIVK